MKTPDEDPHPNGDASRYDSAKGWDPDDKYDAKRQKLIDDYRRRHPEDFCNESMFETRPANDAGKGCRRAPRNPQLFGDLWRRGELAVLFAEPGLGKSILAVHIAESIARGRSAFASDAASERRSDAVTRIPASRHPALSASLRPEAVLYVDLERTGVQFRERYTIRSPIPGIRPVKYRFSPNFSRTGIRQAPIEVPDIFGGDLSRYYRYSIESQLNASPADIRIIDSLGHLDPKGGPRAAIRYLRALKLTAATTGQSILVIAHAKPTGPQATRLLSLRDLQHAEITEIADTVFAIGRTTLGPEWRYIKQLKSNNRSSVLGFGSLEDSVLVYQIARSEGFGKSSPPYAGCGVMRNTGGIVTPERGVAAASADGVVLSSGGKQATEITEPTEYGIAHSLHSRALAVSRSSVPASRPLALPPSPEMAGPFLGFQFAGIMPEAAAIHDYAAEAAKLNRESTRPKRVNKRDDVVDMFLDREYWRYLER